VAAGDHMFIFAPKVELPAAPCTISMAARRTLPLAAVLAHAVLAGTMASSSGRAAVTPMPLRTVRRERWRLVISMASPGTAITGVRQLR
jgi:hypothetical protein